MSKTPWTYLDAPDMSRLDLASVLVNDTIGVPYLVGSCLERADYRDVDIRVILTDKDFKRLFGGRLPHPLRHLIEVAITDHYIKATGLRIDFQIQRMTTANKQYAGRRHPLGIYPHTTSAQEETQ